MLYVDRPSSLLQVVELADSESPSYKLWQIQACACTAAGSKSTARAQGIERRAVVRPTGTGSIETAFNTGPTTAGARVSRGLELQGSSSANTDTKREGPQTEHFYV
eukprot:5607120-Amphidinium_carterae.1